MSVRGYLLSLPERVMRSALGLGAGLAREAGEVVLPDGVRQSQLYQNLVASTLRFLIEQVGGAEGVYRSAESLPDQFLVRRAAGNAVELLGIVAFRASPVWVLAALADVCGIGRQIIPEVAGALKAKGLLDQHAEFATLDQLLDGLERTSSRIAATVNTPPLDVNALRAEWQAIRAAAASLPAAHLPTGEMISTLWSEIKDESVRQNVSLFETSSAMAMSAVNALPDGVRWLSASARVGAVSTGNLLAAALLLHYRKTLGEIRSTGYLTYVNRHLQPYVRAAVSQSSPARRTLTQQLIERARIARAERSLRSGREHR
jgi:hypothetical protein